MESAYSRRTHQRPGNAGTRKQYHRRKKQVELAPRERRRLLQLGVCLVLFLAVFLGRGIFPERLEVVRGELLQVIQTDTDFKAAFSNLGRSIHQGEPVLETIGELWVDVFAGGGRVSSTFADPLDHAPLYHEELAFLNSSPNVSEVMLRRSGMQLAPEEPAAVLPPQPQETAATALLPPEPQPVYSGAPLPDNATMEKPALGLDATTAPVMAVVSSDYGWREHPIEGGEKFHAGTDLAAPYGDTVHAFADGVVDYIGESPAYGQYLQLRHAGGVTSFYAHCSKLCVQQGQQVTLGEKVAEVGDTGETTGPHLHFELRLNGTLLNPVYYIETESE